MQSLAAICLRAFVSLLLCLAAAGAAGYLLYADLAQGRDLVNEYHIFYIGIIVVACATTIATGIMTYLVLMRAMRNDIQSIGRMFDDIRHGGLRPDYPMALAEFAGVFQYLRDSGRKLVEEKKKLKGLGLIDHLSQLNNRRYFEKRLKELFKLAKTHGPSSVLIIDIDHFKSVNDTRGHDVGDALIVGFAKALHTAVRQSDFLARLGGDEFCVIYPYTPLDKVIALDERLRRQLPRELALGNGIVHPLKWTGGLSAMAARDEKFDDVLWRADKALRQAKEAGRNNTKVCPPDDTGTAKVPLQVLS